MRFTQKPAQIAGYSRSSGLTAPDEARTQEGEIDHRRAAGHDGHAQRLSKEEHRECPQRVRLTNECAEGQGLEPGKKSDMCARHIADDRWLRPATKPLLCAIVPRTDRIDQISEDANHAVTPNTNERDDWLQTASCTWKGIVHPARTSGRSADERQHAP
jgi:hypothetical protein